MSHLFRNLHHQYSENDTIFQTAYGKKNRVSLTFPENSRWTKQSFKDECDINNVMARYLSTGEMPVLNQQAPQYLDVSGIEYQSAMEFVAGAQTLFQELPSHVRNRFQNDPGAFLDFCSNEKNREEMAEMGLLRPSNPPADTQPPTGAIAPVTSPPNPAPSTP